MNHINIYCIFVLIFQVFISTAEAEKASSNMHRQARREKEDYSFVSNRVYNNVEAKDKVCFNFFDIHKSV